MKPIKTVTKPKKTSQSDGKSSKMMTFKEALQAAKQIKAPKTGKEKQTFPTMGTRG